MNHNKAYLYILKQQYTQIQKPDQLKKRSDKISVTVYNPITLKEFVNNKYTVLYDSTLGHDIIVETHDGVPWCKSCNTDDCGHVGFTVCLEQKYDNEGSVFD